MFVILNSEGQWWHAGCRADKAGVPRRN